ncbi:MAG TPA: ATPase [Firmicutes bacterium]|nr:ATPase [Bacillota bacterium]
MKIAMPVFGEEVSAHFGHCEKFALVEVDPAGKTVIQTDWATPPAHEPGILPAWLHEQQVDLVMTGGMGERAQALFARQGIQVITGVAGGTVEQVIEQYLKGTLQAGDNLCDH